MATPYKDINARSQRISNERTELKGTNASGKSVGKSFGPKTFYSGSGGTDASSYVAAKPAARAAGYKKP